MSLGDHRPLDLLPFGHRQSSATGMFRLTPPLTADERGAVADDVGQRAPRPEAVSRIARRCREWAAIVARGRKPDERA